MEKRIIICGLQIEVDFMLDEKWIQAGRGDDYPPPQQQNTVVQTQGDQCMAISPRRYRVRRKHLRWQCGENCKRKTGLLTQHVRLVCATNQWLYYEFPEKLKMNYTGTEAKFGFLLELFDR